MEELIMSTRKVLEEMLENCLGAAYPCSGIPVITSTSSQNASTKPAEFTMPIWRTCGRATNGCGTRHGIFSRPSQN